MNSNVYKVYNFLFSAFSVIQFLTLMVYLFIYEFRFCSFNKTNSFPKVFVWYW